MKPLLDITDVSLSYHSLSGETPALSHISFQLMPGEFLAIVRLWKVHAAESDLWSAPARTGTDSSGRHAGNFR